MKFTVLLALPAEDAENPSLETNSIHLTSVPLAR